MNALRTFLRYLTITLGLSAGLGACYFGVVKNLTYMNSCMIILLLCMYANDKYHLLDPQQDSGDAE